MSEPYDDLFGREPARAAEPGGRHDLHVTHLVLGIAFLGIALVWLLSQVGLLPTADVRLWAPAPFLLAGGLGLAAVVLSSRRRG